MRRSSVLHRLSVFLAKKPFCYFSFRRGAEANLVAERELLKKSFEMAQQTAADQQLRSQAAAMAVSRTLEEQQSLQKELASIRTSLYQLRSTSMEVQASSISRFSSSVLLYQLQRYSAF